MTKEEYNALVLKRQGLMEEVGKIADTIIDDVRRNHEEIREAFCNKPDGYDEYYFQMINHRRRVSLGAVTHEAIFLDIEDHGDWERVAVPARLVYDAEYRREQITLAKKALAEAVAAQTQEDIRQRREDLVKQLDAIQKQLVELDVEAEKS